MTDSTAVTVLVIGNSGGEVTAACQALADAGYRVIGPDHDGAGETPGGFDQPDVIVVSVAATDTTDWATLRALKADPERAGIPVVLLAVDVDPAALTDGLRLGAHDFLRAPTDSVELLARVQAADRVGRLAAQLRHRDAELASLSRTDQLTGLANRRHIEDYLASATSLARRNLAPMAVLVVDIDHLRSVNDSRGYAAGDTVLREIARRLRASVRAEDMIGRWGNEVFLVVLPMTGVEGAVDLAERLRHAASDIPCRLPDESLLTVTLSVGCAASMVDSAETLVRAADEARCRAKESGRNRSVMANSAGFFVPVAARAADPGSG